MQQELIKCWARFMHLREAIDGSSMYLIGSDLYISDLSEEKYAWLADNTEALALFFPQAKQIHVITSDCSFTIRPNEHLSTCQ